MTMQPVKCVNCDSDRIAEVDEAPLYAFVNAIDDGTGEIEWSGWTDTDWDFQHPAHDPPVFECMNCGKWYTIENGRLVIPKDIPSDVSIEVRGGTIADIKSRTGLTIEVIDWDEVENGYCPKCGGAISLSDETDARSNLRCKTCGWEEE